MLLLENKVIIVTGGNGLLGKEIIRDLENKGALAINFDINVDTDLEAKTVHCDITSDREIHESIILVSNNIGNIDGLVNNAYPRSKDWGIYEFEKTPYASWRQNIDWQLNSYVFMCQEVIKLMKVRKSGSIVNISSIYGVVGNDFTIYEGTKIIPPAAYSTIKGGLINLTRYLASRFGSEGIRLNCVSPGGIFDNQPEPFVKAYEKKVPMKRMGNPDDIAPVVSFLLSDEAKYITGQNLIVDGGWTAI